MATGVTVWSKTAATNNTIDSAVNFAEGQAPSSVNDSARGLMASVAKWRDDLSGSVTTAGSSTAYTATSNQTFASLTAGIEITCQFDEDCGATVTLNVDGLGAKPLRSAAGVELVAGAIKAGSVHRATYFTSNSGEWLLHNVNPTIIAADQVVTASIANDQVTYAKIQNVSATSRILGRKTAAAGDVEELTLSETLDFVGSAARGDVLIRGASSWSRVALGGAGSVLGSDGTDMLSQPAGGRYLHVNETQANNTASTTNFTGSSWIKLGLNTTVENDIGSASISSSQITLPAGTYRVDLRVPSPQSGGGSIVMKLRFRNVTDGTTAALSPTFAWQGGGTAGGSFPLMCDGQFTISGSKVFEAQCYQNSGTGFVLGGNKSTGYAESEIYTEVFIRKIA